MWFKISDPKWIKGEESLGLGCSFVDTTLSVNHKRKYCWIVVPNISHFGCLLGTTVLSSDKLQIGNKNFQNSDYMKGFCLHYVCIQKAHEAQQ